MHTRTQEKGAATLQETDPDLSECPGVSSGGMGQWWPASGLEALSVAVPAWDLMKEVTIIFITSTIVLAPGQITRRKHSPAHQEKIGLKIY